MKYLGIAVYCDPKLTARASFIAERHTCRSTSHYTNVNPFILEILKLLENFTYFETIRSLVNMIYFNNAKDDNKYLGYFYK